MSEGRVQLRSNIVIDPERWDPVPGDGLQHYASYRLRLPYRPTSRQHDEHMYYVPCSRCGRRINQIQLVRFRGSGCAEGCGREQLGRPLPELFASHTARLELIGGPPTTSERGVM